MKVGDKKQNDHKHLVLIIFSSKQGLGWSENKRENKLDKEQEWTGKHIQESLDDIAFSLSVVLMLISVVSEGGDKMAGGKKEANWTKLTT